jgi:hypothetical protein
LLLLVVTAKPSFLCFDHSDEAITLAFNGPDVAWLVGGITEPVPQLLHRYIQAVIEVAKVIVGPQSCAQHLTGNHLALCLDQCRQNLQRLVR